MSVAILVAFQPQCSSHVHAPAHKGERVWYSATPDASPWLCPSRWLLAWQTPPRICSKKEGGQTHVQLGMQSGRQWEVDHTAMGGPATCQVQCMHPPPHPGSVSRSNAVRSLGCGRLPACAVPQGAGRPSNVHPNACVDGVRSIGGRQAATTWGDGWGADRCGRRADRSG